MSVVHYTQADHEDKAKKLDMMLRLAHADWLEMLIEWSGISMSDPQDTPIFRTALWKNFNKALAIVEVFGDDLAQDFHRYGHVDPIKWWHENIGAIGMRSDNEMVQELTMEYLWG